MRGEVHIYHELWLQTLQQELGQCDVGANARRFDLTTLATILSTRDSRLATTTPTTPPPPTTTTTQSRQKKKLLGDKPAPLRETSSKSRPTLRRTSHRRLARAVVASASARRTARGAQRTGVSARRAGVRRRARRSAVRRRAAPARCRLVSIVSTDARRARVRARLDARRERRVRHTHTHTHTHTRTHNATQRPNSNK